jgi:hypothetical protein
MEFFGTDIYVPYPVAAFGVPGPVLKEVARIVMILQCTSANKTPKFFETEDGCCGYCNPPV